MLSVIADGGIILSRAVNDKATLARQMLLYRDFHPHDIRGDLSRGTAGRPAMAGAEPGLLG
jgi:hypothetical protein